MNNRKLKLTAIAASLFFTSKSFAALDDQMRDAFDMLTNTTSPNAYETSRRGGISGGSLFLKSPIKRTNVLSATAPSFSSGCGGIDLYGGSFSYINADQFIETFQAVGSNALGYGVKLAVQSGCPTCEQVMTSLEKTAQFINSMNVDSCQAAQGLVSAGVDFATTAKADVSAKTYGISTGQWEDLNEAWGWASESGTSATKQLESANPTAVSENITINTTWKAMKEAEIANVFGGDDQFLELVMTMIGTVVIKNPSSDTDSDPKPIVYEGAAIKLTDLIDGGTLSIYKCDTTDATGCLSPPLSPSQSVTITGLKDMVNESLLGTDGLVSAYSTDSAWSDTAKKTLEFPTLIGHHCLQKIRQSAMTGSIDTLGTYIGEICSERMALELAYMQVTSYIQTTLSALKNLNATPAQESAKEEAERVLKSSRERYYAEYKELEKDASYQDIKAKLETLSFQDMDTNTITGN
ncbi:conjugal transfer protein TraH [Vibrio coralliilyticus]|nr:conjugal transfer protein TraH [Vibrio coralliilyticus]